MAQGDSVANIISPKRTVRNDVSSLHFPLDRVGRFDFQAANRTSLLIRFDNGQTKGSVSHDRLLSSLDKLLALIERVIVLRFWRFDELLDYFLNLERFRGQTILFRRWDIG